MLSDVPVKLLARSVEFGPSLIYIAVETIILVSRRHTNPAAKPRSGFIEGRPGLFVLPFK